VANTNVSSGQPELKTEVVVIGAGPAGLAVAACLNRAGVPFVILERDDCVGSAWRRHYDRLHLHTSRRYSGLPHFPFPADYPTYPSRLQVVAYFEAYAQHFDIEPHYRQAVVSVRAQDGLWETQTQGSRFASRNVVIATGINHQPVLPTWPGQDSFQGNITHSAEYRNGEAYRGKSVLVVGFGNSGAEIALDLWEHGAQPSLSVRSAVNVISRDVMGFPIQRLSILTSGLPAPLVDALTTPMSRLRFGDLRAYGLQKASYGSATQVRTYSKIPVIDVGTIKLIKQGHVKVYGGLEAFTQAGVRFSDGRQAPFESVILATGYRPGFSSFLPSASLPAPGEVSSAPGLYFCGFHNSSGGLLREISREALRIADAVASREGQ